MRAKLVSYHTSPFYIKPFNNIEHTVCPAIYFAKIKIKTLYSSLVIPPLLTQLQIHQLFNPVQSFFNVHKCFIPSSSQRVGVCLGKKLRRCSTTCFYFQVIMSHEVAQLLKCPVILVPRALFYRQSAGISLHWPTLPLFLSADGANL